MSVRPSPILGRDDARSKVEFERQMRARLMRLSAYVAKTATYTATWAERTINCTSGTFTVTLPTAVDHAGEDFEVKNSGVGTITAAGTSSQTFDGAASVSIGAGFSYTFRSDGANWIIV